MIFKKNYKFFDIFLKLKNILFKIQKIEINTKNKNKNQINFQKIIFYYIF